MEPDEIARRIRQIHDIETAMDESGEGKSPLTDALHNAIPYMTPEEIRETLFRTLDKLDELYGYRTNAEELLRSEREAHNRIVDNLNGKIAAKDRLLAEKEARIAALEKALAKSKADNVYANHKAESANQEKFCGTSKKGIDKKHHTNKGRDDHKDDFDGTPRSASPQETESGQHAEGVETIARDRSDIRKEQKVNRGKYTLADATEKIIMNVTRPLFLMGQLS